MTELSSLLFDVDGTLADTERDGHRVAFNLAFAEAGLDWEWSVELYGELLSVTGGKERMRLYLDKYNTEFKRPDYLDDFIADLHKTKTKHYTELLNTGAIPFRTGVLRLLNEARQTKLRMGIATTTTPANVSALLLNTIGKEWQSWFEVIAAGDIVPAKKPAADIYEYAMKEMDISANESLAFEDSRNGILSSVGAGLKTIITINTYTKTDDFSAAALVLDHLGEPDEAFNVLQGDSHGHSYVDVDLLNKVAVS